MKIVYADPPYPGLAARYYKAHPDYAGEVDHRALLEQLAAADGWILHTSTPALGAILAIADDLELDYRLLSWVKPWAAFKPSQSLAYAWEPVLVHPARPARRSPRFVMRDWLAEPMTMRRGLVGAKPERVCHWLFEAVGADVTDELVDAFPGTGAVTRAWHSWTMQLHEPPPPLEPADALPFAHD